ncbi:MAG: TolC family protein [Methylotenera sp.]|nr:TolC family protein [Methylotenera sp.]
MNTPLPAKKPLYGCLLFSLLLFSTLALNAVSAKAEQALTLTEAIALATENQPLLQSLDDAAASSRQTAIAEAQLPDPKIKFGVINLPVTNRNALRFDREDMTMINVGIAQDVIPLKKRQIASNMLEAEADQFHTEQIATARSIERDVAMAWLDVFEAQRKSELYQKITEEFAAERSVLISRMSSGGAQASEVLQLENQLSMTNDKGFVAKRDERKARANLSRWIGAASLRSISDELPVMSNHLTNTSNPDTFSVAIEEHPLLQNAHQTEKVAQFDVDKAQANLQQNWGWEVGYGKRFSDRSDMLTFQVSIDLQLDRANRQDRRTAEKLVLVERARKLTEDKRRELTAELESALADAQAAEARENEHQSRLIPNAAARLSVAQAGYMAGKKSLSEVWEARRSLLEVELDHWAILTDRQRAAVKIDYLLNDNRLSKEKQ